MLFWRSKKREKDLASGQQKKSELGESYWQIVRRQFWQNTLAAWAFRGLLVLVGIALFADILANSRPLYYQKDGSSHFPIIEQYFGGQTELTATYIDEEWKEESFDYVFFPPIAFSPQAQDAYHAGFEPPFTEQAAELYEYPATHYLGTDDIGRDVAAGLIHGTRTALLVGLLAMLIASFIGVLIGGLGGYFGDNGLRMYVGQALFYGLTLPFAFFLSFIALSQYLYNWSFLWYVLALLASFFFLSTVLFTLSRKLSILLGWKKQFQVPVDLMVTRLIEIMSSLPVLLLILAVIGMLDNPSIWNIMFIIGLVSWPQIARYTRQEFLRIRQLEYIEAAKAFGFSNWRIMLRHALPNALGPILVAIAFGIASTVLLEAFLSFLGIGVDEEVVTWGKMLEEARAHPEVWWMAVLPGLAIFATVTIFNLIGEGLIDALDPKLKR